MLKRVGRGVSNLMCNMMQYYRAEDTILQQTMVSRQFAFGSLVLLLHLQSMAAVDVFTLLGPMHHATFAGLGTGFGPSRFIPAIRLAKSSDTLLLISPYRIPPAVRIQ